MIRMSEKALFSSAIFIFTCVIMYVTLDMRNDVALVPRMVGTLLLIFSGLQVLMDLFPAVRRRLAFLDGSGKGSVGGEGVVQEQQDPSDTPLSRLRFFGWITAYIVLIPLTSLLVATIIALFVYLKWINKEPWLISIIYPLATALFIYVVFVIGFKLHYFV